MISFLQHLLRGCQWIGKGFQHEFGAQNCYAQVQGAFTGENSIQTVKDLGAKYILIGHSERRQIFGETDAAIADKVALTQSLGLTPLLCIGETLAERESTHTYRILETQLELGLAKADKTKPVVIAYEPVWAIGTGKVATPEQVAETHTDVQTILTKLGFKAPILYGGTWKLTMLRAWSTTSREWFLLVVLIRSASFIKIASV